jgi:ABC-type branched-subunit amino acid transport system permease subunit
MPPDPIDRDDEERAPLLGTWRRWYVVVLVTLAAIVAGFAYLSAHYQ